MFRKLVISFACALVSWSSGEACSIPPPKVKSDNSYEQNLQPYFANLHRNMVDAANNIAVGKFKYSRKQKKHIFYISEHIKGPNSTRFTSNAHVTFNQIDDNRIEYRKPDTERVLGDWFWPTYRAYGIEGRYGPGDCRLSLDIIKNANYLIFANSEFEIASMFLLTKNRMAYKSAIKNLVEKPLERYGVSFSIQEMLNRGENFQLLSTSQCAPVPTYMIVKSSEREREGNEFNARPIRVFDVVEERYSYELSDLDKKSAAEKGFAKGLYTNAPSMKQCRAGQNYLMLSQWQMTPEENGYFQLDNTVFEHHISPELISYNSASKILNAQTTP